MFDEDGRELSEKEILKGALDHIAEAVCFLLEMESPEGIALACMVDSMLDYGESIYRGVDPRSRDDYALSYKTPNLTIVK